MARLSENVTEPTIAHHSSLRYIKQFYIPQGNWHVMALACPSGQEVQLMSKTKI